MTNDITARYFLWSRASGRVFGTFHARTEQEAIYKWARAYGYEHAGELQEATGYDWQSDLAVECSGVLTVEV